MVERYSMSVQGPFDRDPPGLEPDNDGDWVLHSDYTTLERQIAELRAERDNFAVTVVNLANQRDAADARDAQLSEALTEIATLNKSRDQLQEIARSTLSGSGAAHPVQPGWRDMASAPKDGTEFIALIGGNAVSARWLDGEPGYSGAGWVTIESRERFLSDHVLAGWMPLPAAPQPKGEE